MEGDRDGERRIAACEADEVLDDVCAEALYPILRQYLILYKPILKGKSVTVRK